MIQINVALPSGHSENFSVPQSCRAGDLKILAQKSLGKGFLDWGRRVGIRRDFGRWFGGHLGQPKGWRQVRGPRSAEECTAGQGYCTRHGAFAAILADGSVVTWGDPSCGGNSSAVQDQLRSVQKVEATWNSFAGILMALWSRGAIQRQVATAPL